MQRSWCSSCYIQTPVYDVCCDSVLCSGRYMCDVVDWAAVVLQVDVKTTGCYSVVEAADGTLRAASGEFVALLLCLLLQLWYSIVYLMPFVMQNSYDCVVSMCGTAWWTLQSSAHREADKQRGSKIFCWAGVLYTAMISSYAVLLTQYFTQVVGFVLWRIFGVCFNKNWALSFRVYLIPFDMLSLNAVKELSSRLQVYRERESKHYWLLLSRFMSICQSVKFYAKVWLLSVVK